MFSLRRATATLRFSRLHLLNVGVYLQIFLPFDPFTPLSFHSFCSCMLRWLVWQLFGYLVFLRSTPETAWKQVVAKFVFHRCQNLAPMPACTKITQILTHTRFTFGTISKRRAMPHQTYTFRVLFFFLCVFYYFCSSTENSSCHWKFASRLFREWFFLQTRLSLAA